MTRLRWWLKPGLHTTARMVPWGCWTAEEIERIAERVRELKATFGRDTP